MNDFLFSNNNHPAIKRLAKRIYISNKQRNRITVFAIILTTVLITSVFSIGVSYTESIQNQAVVQRGTAAQVLVVNPTENNLLWLKRDSSVHKIGIERQIATAKTDQSHGANGIFLRWADETQWQDMIMPAMTGIAGKYPQMADEIFLPTWLLSALGIEQPVLGMEISLTCRYGGTTIEHPALSEYAEQTFRLSGWYLDRSSNYQLGNAVGYISDAYWRGSVATEENTRCAASLLFEDNVAAANAYQRILSGMEISGNSQLNLLIYSSSQTGTLLSLAVVVVLIVLCGYLLIYNILFISVSNEIHSFGQLKTIGTTKRQIKKIIFRQVGQLCAVGVPIGLAAGAAISLALVPLGVLGMSGGYAVTDSDMVVVSFSPIIYIGAAGLAILTTFMGSMKAAGIAGNISPIEALRYQNGQQSGPMKDRKGHQHRLSWMAWRNVFRDKKSTMMTFISLFLGLTIFLVTAGILASIDVSLITEQYFAEGEDVSLIMYDLSAQPISEELVSDMMTMDGVSEISVYRRYRGEDDSSGFLENQNSSFDKFVETLFSVEPGYAPYEENYHEGTLWKSAMVGISETDFLRLTEHLNADIDYEDFIAGSIAFYLCAPDMLTASEMTPLPQFVDFVCSETTCSLQMYHIPVGTDAPFLRLGVGLTPDQAVPYILVSQTYMDRMGLPSITAKVKVSLAEGMEQTAVDQINHRINSGNVVLNSRYEKDHELKESFRMVNLLGNSLSIILLFIGLMNFVNTISVSVTIRKHELAVLESIGMTKKQIRRMLVLEGSWYWLIPYVLIFTLGSAVFAGVFWVVKSKFVPYVTFAYPILSLMISALAVLSVCVVVPVIVYRSFSSSSVVERLRQSG